MGEERVREMRDPWFDLIMLSSSVFFNLQFITYIIYKYIIAYFDFCFLSLIMQYITDIIYYNIIQSPFPPVNYYHTKSVWGRIAKREGDCFWGAANLKANERGEGDAMLETCSETRMKQDVRDSTHEITWAEVRCCQGGLCGLMLQISAKQPDPADDYKGEKRDGRRKGTATTRQKWWWLYLQHLGQA